MIKIEMVLFLLIIVVMILLLSGSICKIIGQIVKLLIAIGIVWGGFILLVLIAIKLLFWPVIHLLLDH
jgi:hypothetical protein